MLLKLLLFLLISFFSLLVSIQVARCSMAKPGCQETCGNLTVPYPFGIGKGCYLDKSFEVSCDGSHQDVAPLRLVHNNQFPIADISMEAVRVIHKSPINCSSSANTRRKQAYKLDAHFSYSHERNHFVAVGCDIDVNFIMSGMDMVETSCASSCHGARSSLHGPSTSCNGVNGCCNTSIPIDVQSFYAVIYSGNDTSSHVLPCTHVFVAEKNHSLINMSEQNMFSFPIVLNWAIRHTTCSEVYRDRSYGCGHNSRCIESNNGLDILVGHKCQCLEGYKGNPYLPSGCQDINECEHPSNNTCRKGEHCVNTSGSYMCTRPRDHTLGIVSAILASVIGLLVVGALGYWAQHELHRRKRNKIKQKHFRRNGGFLLKHQMSSKKASAMTINLYATEEIEKATDNFSQSRFLGKGGQGTVYKGMLRDRSVVAIKKSNAVNEDQVERFVNEVFILAQINHRNIVKLLGCCLEYEVPLLVYEYVPNGNLSEHLHDEAQVSTFSWKDRVRIAGEVAGALAYLHSYASPAMFHRDIKPGNILLDTKYRAVVSDFGLSRSVPVSRTHLTTAIEGTFGYLDPEYFRSGQFTEKSDVYSFGVMLTELLTRRKAVSSRSSDEGLVLRFQYSIKNNILTEILDTVVLMEADVEDYLIVGMLAKRCLKRNPKKRPSMKEIVAELEKLKSGATGTH